MLLKLMKQDVRATARLMLPVYAAAIILAVFARIFESLSNRLPGRTTVNLFGGLVAFLFAVAMIAVVVMSFIMMVWRFHKNYMTDEGYLMFTLPVSTAELIWSKLLVAIGWFFCSGLVVLVAAMISASGSIGFIGFDQIPADQLRRLLVSLTVTCLVSGISLCLMLYACMAIGQSFRRHKTAMTVVFFFVFYIVLQIVGVQLVTGALVNTSDSLTHFYDAASMMEMMSGFLWRVAAVSAVSGAVFYAIAHFMLAKRLNLQ